MVSLTGWAWSWHELFLSRSGSRSGPGTAVSAPDWLSVRPWPPGSAASLVGPRRAGCGGDACSSVAPRASTLLSIIMSANRQRRYYYCLTIMFDGGLVHALISGRWGGLRCGMPRVFGDARDNSKNRWSAGPVRWGGRACFLRAGLSK